VRTLRLEQPLAWGKALAALGLLLFAPFLLAWTPLAVVAGIWRGFLLLVVYGLTMAFIFGALLGAALPTLQWLERHLRAWVARFAGDPEGLWLAWARHAHHPAMARWCLDRAVALGGREAQFQEALVLLEGGLGVGGQTAAVDRLRRAAQRGHAEAAFRLAEALRTGHGAVLAEAGEAQTWYQRAAALGFGPAAAWLAQAHEDGDGVPVDAGKAQHWSVVAGSLQPHPPLSRNLLRHDAAPGDPLVQLTGRALQGAERAADQLVARRSGRWVLLLFTGAVAVVVLGGVGWVVWAGSAALYHLPLLMAAPLLLILGWLAVQLRRGGPRMGRDRLLEAAEAGEPEACYQLGLAHRRGGPHRPKDDLSAVLWFRQAAEAGHRGAMAALAEAYLGGHGVPRDRREAARWSEAAGRESTS
jgi:hypothetical protein